MLEFCVVCAILSAATEGVVGQTWNDTNTTASSDSLNGNTSHPSETSTPTTGATTPFGPTIAAPTSPLVRNYAWVIALITLASLGIITLFIIQIYILVKMCGTRLCKGYHSFWLGEILMFGIFCSYLTLFAFLPYSSTPTCGIIRFCVGVSYALCFAVLVVKMIVIVSSRRGEVWIGFQFLMLLFVWAVQIVIDVQWMITTPPAVVPSDNKTVWEPWGRCEPGFTPHVQSLVYVMFLIVFCAVFAVVTADIPSNRREGVYIGTASVMTIGVWIIWLLLGFLMEDQNWHEPCIAFGLLVTATILMLVIFLPKMHQLNTMSVEELYGSAAFANCLVNPFPQSRDRPKSISSPVERRNHDRRNNAPSGYEPTFQLNGALPSRRFEAGDDIRDDPRPRSVNSFETQAVLHLRHPADPIYSLRPSSAPIILEDSTDTDLEFTNIYSDRNGKAAPVGGFSYVYGPAANGQSSSTFGQTPATYGQSPSSHLGSNGGSRLYIPRSRFQN